MMKKVAIFGGVIGLVVVLLVALVASGRLAVYIKQPNQSLQMVYTVCDQKIIERYNSAYDDAKPEVYAENMKRLAQDVRALADNDKDPNCQYVLFRYNVAVTRDDPKAQTALDNLKELSDEGRGISGRFNQVQSISEMETMLNVKSQQDQETN